MIMKLELFKEVLKRQIPIDIGKPISMITYQLDHPKNCGDPWIGAYSKHGFWYKFSFGTNNDYEKIVARAYDSDSYKMDYNSLKIWKTIPNCDCRFIVAKNQSDEPLGSIIITYCNDFAVIGVYYVIEEYRHSVSHLANKCHRFGLMTTFSQQWKFATYEISNPSAFSTLQNEKITIIRFNNLSEVELIALLKYDNNVTHLKRDNWLKEWFKQENFNTYVAFKENEVIGYGCSRETAGGYVLPILIGPLYADNFEIASALLYATLKKYYNPDDDYDWDPDIFAIYRRNVYFIVPNENTQMITLMEKLKGETGTLKKERLFYITQTTNKPPNAFINLRNF
uniref:N-acetyltransferase domain-containing protein n=1 Tax=Wuchereria bancrofti TaxID=6293 RepID=A0A1I8ET59_WUCBA